MSKKISDEEKALFRQATKQVKRLKKKQVLPPSPRLQPKVSPTPPPDDRSAGDYYAPQADDHTYPDYYFQEGLSSKQRRQLQRGGLFIESTLDLHGHTRATGDSALRQYLVEAHQLGYRRLLIIHGKSRWQQGPSRLSRVVRKLLYHCPWVIGYHPAQPKHGGSGAVYVWLKALQRR